MRCSPVLRAPKRRAKRLPPAFVAGVDKWRFLAKKAGARPILLQPQQQVRWLGRKKLRAARRVDPNTRRAKNLKEQFAQTSFLHGGNLFLFCKNRQRSGSAALQGFIVLLMLSQSCFQQNASVK